MYLEKDLARGIDGTFMWLMEEIGELATALRNGTHEERSGEFADVLAWLATIANVAGIDLTRGDHGEIRLRLSGLRPAGMHLSGCGEAMRPYALCLSVLLRSCFRLARPRRCRGASGRREIVGVRVGFAGCYKAGLWTPVEVTLRGGSEACRGQRQPDRARRRRRGQPREHAAGRGRSRSARAGKPPSLMNVRFGRVRGWLAAEFQVRRHGSRRRRPSTASADAGQDHFPRPSSRAP